MVRDPQFPSPINACGDLIGRPRLRPPDSVWIQIRLVPRQEVLIGEVFLVTPGARHRAEEIVTKEGRSLSCPFRVDSEATLTLRFNFDVAKARPARRSYLVLCQAGSRARLRIPLPPRARTPNAQEMSR